MKSISIIILSIFLLIITLIVSCDATSESEPNIEEQIELAETKSYCNEYVDSTETTFTIARNWKNYNDTSFCTSYTTAIEQFETAKFNREFFEYDEAVDYLDFWGTLYDTLYHSDKDLFPLLLDSLESLKVKYALNRDQFAKVIVCFVQDIPYTYILQHADCNNLEYSDSPCLGEQIYGILSPYEFLHTLKGDCDTRTVLLYTILKHFNYSPKIAVSRTYEHSMLVLDVAAAGEHLYEYGKKYYFWETTGQDWLPGVIPAGMGDLYWWDIALE